MTNILGIVGSARRWGNSELMVRQVLQGALSGGGSAQLLRLTGLRLESCTGCMRCAITGKACRLNDDMAWLIDAVQAADALVLAAPTYFLGPAAVIKLVLDRLLMVTSHQQDTAPPIRPAVTIITAGLDDWRGVSLPYLNALVAAFGFQPIESLTAIAPGPGEVLLDENLMAQALAAGQRLGKGELDPAPADVAEVRVIYSRQGAADTRSFVAVAAPGEPDVYLGTVELVAAGEWRFRISVVGDGAGSASITVPER